MNQIIVLGTGGNAIDIAEAIDAAAGQGHSGRLIGFLDDNASLWGRYVVGRPVIGSLSIATTFDNALFINGIGSPLNFWKKPDIIQRTGLPIERFATVVHPRAWVSPSARLGRGVAILANASVGAEAVLGHHVIVLPNAVVSHHDQIGDHASIASGVCLSGNVTVGQRSYIGSNSTVRGFLRIGEQSLVGMGATVIHDIPANQVVVGTPARYLRATVENEAAAQAA